MQILKQYHDRDVLLHLKPWSYDRGFDVVLGETDDANDWERILKPETKDCMWLLVESENTALPELENAERCMRGLKKYLK